MATTQSRIVTLGEAMLRLTAPRGERLREASSLRSHVAGSEANVARTLAALGVPVSWISALPASALGDRIVRELAASGVDVSYVVRPAKGRVGLFFVEQGSSPRGSRVLYDRAGSAFTEMSSFDEHALEDASFAIVSGITPALGARSRELAERFGERARALGARLCIDVNYRRLLWDPAQARRGLQGLLEQADVVVCSERDARTVFGSAGKLAELASSFAARWAPQAAVVVVTSGARGSVLVRSDSVIEQPVYPAEIVDRFGAGDAFLGGLVWGLWSGENDEQALRAATMLAALKCSLVGDVAQFTPEELAATLADSDPTAILR